MEEKTRKEYKFNLEITLSEENIKMASTLSLELLRLYLMSKVRLPFNVIHEVRKMEVN